MNALLVLEDGRRFPCRSFTGSGEVGGELVFNTSMTGYQEILTDPSYTGQMVVMTYPMIGSYGINFDDIESESIHVSAFLVKEYQEYYSNFRSEITLAKYLHYYGVFGLEGLDTRALTNHLRQFGSMRAFVSTEDLDYKSLVVRAKAMPEIIGLEMVSKVTTAKAYRWGENLTDMINQKDVLDRNIWKFKSRKLSVVALDYGIKFSILRSLVLHGFEVIVVPGNTNEHIIEGMAPDGLLLSNGPGDPASLEHTIETVRKLMKKGLPIFGVCLGHQILGLALGASTYKLDFGHRGANHPVKNLLTGKIEITAQNHGFAIDVDSIVACNAQVTHVNLNDNTVEGIKHKKLPVFSVQYHPEGSPGPKDSEYLFEQFKVIIDNG